MEALMHCLEVIGCAVLLLVLCALLLNGRELLEAIVDLMQEHARKLRRWWRRLRKRKE